MEGCGLKAARRCRLSRRHRRRARHSDYDPEHSRRGRIPAFLFIALDSVVIVLLRLLLLPNS